MVLLRGALGFYFMDLFTYHIMFLGFAAAAVAAARANIIVKEDEVFIVNYSNVWNNYLVLCKTIWLDEGERGPLSNLSPRGASEKG